MKKHIYIAIAVALLIAMTGCEKKEKVKKAVVASVEYDFASAEVCADCHEGIYNEWKSSMHAKSAPMSDKVHAAVFKITGNDIKTGTKDGKVPGCVKCHVPIAALDGAVDLTSKLIYSEGITCTYCHRIKSLKPAEGRALGAHAYEYNATGVYSSGIVKSESGGHETDYNALYSRSEYCNGCHESRKNKTGVNICNTYEEYKSSRTSKRMTCQNCHMKSREGRAASGSEIVRKLHFHGSSGGHDIEQVKSAVGLDIELADGGKKFNVIVQNKSAAHKVPTAAPLRRLFIKVIQLSANKKEPKIIKENYKNSPKEDKNALFVVAFKDIDGKIGVPPWKAVSVGFDKRLPPSGERIIMYDVAGKEVKRIRVELYYRLIPAGFPKPLVYDSFDSYTKLSHLLAEKEITIK